MSVMEPLQTPAETLFQARVRKINQDLWPSFSEQIADRLEKPPAPTIKKKSMRKVEPGNIPSSHTAHTASSIRKMDDFIRSICQPPVKVPKKLDQSSLRPVLKHMAQMERAVEHLQEEHSHQIRLETESQKTFQFMKKQIDSLKKAFGILSEVLVDEVEDIRSVMDGHMKNVAEMLDEARFRGNLREDSETVRDQINRVKIEVENKVAIIHSNMLKLQSAIDENQSGLHRDLDEIKSRMDSITHEVEEETQPALTELSEKFESIFRKLNADFSAYQESHAESLGQIFQQLNTCIHRCNDLAKATVSPASSPNDLAALEANVETIAMSVRDLVQHSNDGIAPEERERLLSEARENARQDMRVISDRFARQTEDLRLDIDQIEESVISGFEALSTTLQIPNPLKLYDKSDTDHDGGFLLNPGPRNIIEPLT